MGHLTFVGVEMQAPIHGGIQGPAGGRQPHLMKSLFSTGGSRQRTVSRGGDPAPDIVDIY